MCWPLSVLHSVCVEKNPGDNTDDFTRMLSLERLNAKSIKPETHEIQLVDASPLKVSFKLNKGRF